MITKNIFTIIFLNYIKSVLWIYSMLREEGKSRAWVPLTREGVDSCLHADDCRSVAFSSLTSIQRCVGYRAFRVGSAYWHPESSPAIVRVSLLTTPRCEVYLAVPSLGEWNKKSPSDSFGNWRGLWSWDLYRYERYSLSLVNRNLTGTKLERLSLPSKYH